MVDLFIDLPFAVLYRRLAIPFVVPIFQTSAGHSREDNLALLVRDVRELVEELMEQVGSTDAKALVDLKYVAQNFKVSCS